VASEEEDRRVRAERDRVRQAEHRSRVAAALADSQRLCLETEDGAADFMTVRDINRVSLTLATSVATELVGCPGPQSCLAVMERFLNHGMIWPLLSSYYKKPEEAKVITNFIQSFSGELDSVKNPHSWNKLARKVRCHYW
jgi:hypothetical protein